MTLSLRAFLVLAGRFIAGRPMNGRARTNATWLHWSTHEKTEHQRSAVWHHRPGWHRTSWRTGTLVFLLAFLYGCAADRSVTLTAFLVLACAAVPGGLWLAWHRFRNWHHHERTVKPLYQTSTLVTGTNAVYPHPHGHSHKRYIKVPRNYRNDKNARIRLVVPATWDSNGGQQKRLLDLVSQRLGGDWDMTPVNYRAWPPYLEFFPSPAPPDRLLFEDIRAALDKGSIDKLIIGMGVHERIIEIDLDSDAPHIAISMGTGGGKSSLLRLIIAYLIHHGVERIDIIDPKRVSQNFAKNIPGVYIWRTMAEQMEAVHNFRLRMESRYDALDTDDALTFPRHVLIIEEQNSFVSYARTYWDDYRAELDPKDRGKVPRRTPVISDLAYILNQGRQACMNVVSVFQRMSASASGSGDMRENYGAKIIARYSPQTWRLLVGTTPVPRSSRINGRARFVLGDEDHLIQMPYARQKKASDWPGLPESEWRDEAYDYAMAGIAACQPDPDPDPVPQPDPPVTLREAIDTGVIPMKYAAAKRARSRALANGGFAAGISGPAGTLYNPADLRAWFESRQRAA